jgi:hypothetical protein
MDRHESLSHSNWECKYHVGLSRNAGGRCCMETCTDIWARCYEN